MPLPPSPAPTRPSWWPAALAMLVAAAGVCAARPVRTATARPAPAWEEVLPAGERSAALQARSARRGELARDVADGRVTLLAAAAAYRDLAAGDPETVAAFRRAFPDGTDDEGYARAVVRRVRVEMVRVGTDPGPAARLEAELAVLATAGPIRLPAPIGDRPAGE